MSCDKNVPDYEWMAICEVCYPTFAVCQMCQVAYEANDMTRPFTQMGQVADQEYDYERQVRRVSWA